MWVSHMGARAHRIGPSSADFSGQKQRAGSEMEQQGLQPMPLWDAGLVGGGLACYVTVTAP